MPSWYSGSPKDSEDKIELVRLFIGDTDRTNFILSDRSIETILKYQENISLAASIAARAIAASYSATPDIEIGKTKVKYSARAPYFHSLADKLAKGGVGVLPGTDGTGVPNVSVFIGGASKSLKNNLESNTDRRDENFEIGHRDFIVSDPTEDEDE